MNGAQTNDAGQETILEEHIVKEDRVVGAIKSGNKTTTTENRTESREG